MTTFKNKYLELNNNDRKNQTLYYILILCGRANKPKAIKEVETLLK